LKKTNEKVRVGKTEEPLKYKTMNCKEKNSPNLEQKGGATVSGLQFGKRQKVKHR